MGVERNNNYGLNIYETMFRSYDPALGRFHQVDPLAEWTINLSPYQYANNDPIYFNDPLGLTANAGWENPGFNDKTWNFVLEIISEVPDGGTGSYEASTSGGGGYLTIGGYFGRNGNIVEKNGVAGAFLVRYLEVANTGGVLDRQCTNRIRRSRNCRPNGYCGRSKCSYLCRQGKMGRCRN
jgi:RHS repeat-associated protein